MKAIDDMPIGETPCMSYPEVFFSDDDVANVPKEYSTAKRLCADCPVIMECRSYAVKWPQMGVWGGTTESSRSRLRTIRNRDAA